MKELFINELRRFRKTALIAAGVHTVILVLLNQLYGLLQLPMEIYMVMLGLYMLAGAGLGLYQFGSYRQPSRWIWLMHRPLAPARIFGALGAAVAVLIAFSIGLPAMLLVLANKLFTHNVVDLRHYLLVPHVMLFVAMAWLCGAYIMLARTRTAFVLVIVPLWLLLHGASGLSMLVPALFCLALLAFVVLKSAKPNRTAPPDTVPALLAVSVPLHLGFFFALFWAGSLTFQYGQMLVGTHPLNMDIDPPGGFTEATRAETPKLVALGLAASKDPRAEHWRRQLGMSDGRSTSPFFLRFVVRQSLGNVQENSFTSHGLRWAFSHDTMRFEATSLRTGKPAGSLGDAQGHPFEAVPIKVRVDDDFTYLLLPHRLAGIITTGTPRTVELARFGKDEYISSVPRTYGNRIYLLTNQRLHAFTASIKDGEPFEPLFQVPLPRQVSDLATADMVHMLDGTLVSFTYGQQMISGVEGAKQVVYWVDGNGAAEQVAERALTHDFPPLFEHKEFWISPIVSGIAKAPAALYHTGAIPDGALAPPSFLRTRPGIAWAAGIGSMIAAALGAWWWLRGSALRPRLRVTWIISCLVFGIPAFLSLIVLQARTRPLATT